MGVVTAVGFLIGRHTDLATLIQLLTTVMVIVQALAQVLAVTVLRRRQPTLQTPVPDVALPAAERRRAGRLAGDLRLRGQELARPPPHRVVAGLGRRGMSSPSCCGRGTRRSGRSARRRSARSTCHRRIRKRDWNRFRLAPGVRRRRPDHSRTVRLGGRRARRPARDRSPRAPGRTGRGRPAKRAVQVTGAPVVIGDGPVREKIHEAAQTPANQPRGVPGTSLRPDDDVIAIPLSARGVVFYVGAATHLNSRRKADRPTAEQHREPVPPPLCGVDSQAAFHRERP